MELIYLGIQLPIKQLIKGLVIYKGLILGIVKEFQWDQKTKEFFMKIQKLIIQFQEILTSVCLTKIKGMKKEIYTFIVICLLMISNSSFSQNKIDSVISTKIKLTQIEQIFDYFVYRAVEYNNSIQDTIILLSSKNEQENKLKLNSYYEIRYKENELFLSESVFPTFIRFNIVQNVRISDVFGLPKIIINSKELENIDERKFISSKIEGNENFEYFLAKFIYNQEFRENRITFIDTTEFKKQNKKKQRKRLKEWKKFEDILLKYKLNSFKRDRFYVKETSTMFFRLYSNSLENEFWFLFNFDKNENWYLFSFFEIDFFN